MTAAPDLKRAAYLAEWECRPPRPTTEPRSWFVTASSGLPEKHAICSACGQEVGYSELFGYFGHTKPGAPGFAAWASQ